MGNPLRGEVDLPVGHKTYVLRLAANALVEAETLLDKGVAEIAEMLNDASTFRLGTARVLLFAGLRERHPEMTLPMAGEIIGEVGIPGIVAKLAESLAAAFPPAEDPAENPPPASPNGTGKDS